MVGQVQAAEGASKIRQGVEVYRHTGAVFQLPHLMVPLAEAARALGRPEEGLNVLAEATAIVENSGERYFEAELYELKGEMLPDQSSSNHGLAGKRPLIIGVGPPIGGRSIHRVLLVRERPSTGELRPVAHVDRPDARQVRHRYRVPGPHVLDEQIFPARRGPDV